MLNELTKSLRNLEVLREIHPRDTMYSHEYAWHYFNVGRSGLLAIVTALCARLNCHGGSSEIKSILDFGCGYGRVARFLRAGFPNARIVVDDLEKDGAAFCSASFECDIVENPLLPDCYDIIWLGSVFTHLPEDIASSLLKRLVQSLRPNGILVFTSQGRYAARTTENYLSCGVDRPKKAPYNLSPETLLNLIKGYYERGYGFANYPRQTGYGIAFVTPAWFDDKLLQGDDIIRIAWQEKGWDAHQDVNAFLRADLNDSRKSNF